MDLKSYIEQSGLTRSEFAKLAKIKPFYLNNLCQRPHKAGKKAIEKIISASGGAVTFDDMTKGQSEKPA